ncbi:hypothetical protein [Parabacteroides sp.]
MNKKIELILKETEDTMSAHAVLYFFRLSNICIEAKPIALLSTTVHVGAVEANLENVAGIEIPNKKQYAIYPKKENFFVPILKGIKEEHPEFKMEVKENETTPVLTDEEMKMLGLTKEDFEEPVKNYLLFTVPDVDEERRDAYTDMTEALYDVAIAKLQEEKLSFLAKTKKYLFAESEEGIEEINNEIDKVYENNKKECDKNKEKKLNEIEEAYQLYLAEKLKEQEVASGNEDSSAGGNSFRMDMQDED